MLLRTAVLAASRSTVVAFGGGRLLAQVRGAASRTRSGPLQARAALRGKMAGAGPDPFADEVRSELAALLRQSDLATATERR